MIGIVMSGHMRTYKLFYKNLNTLVNYLSADLYIHTWNDIDSMTTSSNPIRSYNKGKQIDINELTNLYNPKKILIEKQIIKDPDLLWNYGPQSYYGMACCYYGWSKSLNLIDNLNNYNIVIKLRPDVIIYPKFLNNINKYIDLLNEYDVIVFCMRIKNHLNVNYPVGNDIFFMGKTDAIKFMCNYYNSYDNINKNLKNNNFSTPEEVYWHEYILKNNLKILSVCNYKKEWELQQSYNKNEI